MKRLTIIPLLLALASCSLPDMLTAVDVVQGEQGQLHLLTRGRTGETEGGHFWYHGFHLVTGSTGAWTTEPLSFGAGERASAEFSRHWIADSGRFWLVTESPEGLRVRMRQGQDWIEASFDLARPALPAAAHRALSESQALGAAWAGSDGVLRILWGSWLFEVEATASEARIARALDTGMRCVLQELCYFDATGDRAGQAARYTLDGYWLWQLDCAGDACTWRDEELSLGTSDIGGSSAPRTRRFFHTRADVPVPVLVRRIQPADQHVLYATWPGGERVLVEADIYKSGAAVRPRAGYVAVAQTYGGELFLVVVDGAFADRTIQLGKREDIAQDPMGVIVVDGAAGEEVHIFLDAGDSAIDHLTVQLADDAITEERIALD